MIFDDTMKVVFCFLTLTLLVGCDKAGNSCNSETATTSGSDDAAPVAGQRLQDRILESRKLLEGLHKFGIGIGEAPVERPIREALVELLSSEEGALVFDKMVESDNWPTVLYGLVGLFYTRPADYFDSVEKVRGRANGASVVIDDFTDVESSMSVPVEQLLAKPGGYRMSYGETIPEYCSRKHIAFEFERLDFSGGSIPIAWLDIGSNYLMIDGCVPGEEDTPDLRHIDGNRMLILDRKAEFYAVWSQCFSRAMKGK